MKKKISFMLLFVILTNLFAVMVSARQNPVWRDEPDLPTGSHSFGIVSYEDKIYVFGGRDSANIGGINAVQIFDTITESWSSGTPIPIPLHHMACAEKDGIVYLIGGGSTNSNTPLNTVFAYDIASDTWKELANMTTATQNFSGAVAGDKIYTFGGYTGSTSNKVEVYDIAQNTWETKKEMPRARYGSSIVQRVGDKIYVIGGQAASGGMISNVDIYDIATDSWTTGSPVPYAVSGQAIAAINDTIYIMGGAAGSTIYSNIYAYNTLADTWKLSTLNLTSARNGARLAVVNDRLYILGGNETKNLMQSVSVAALYGEDRLYVLADSGEQIQLSLDHNLGINTDYLWTSSDTSVATVDGYGMITAINEGTCFIECKSIDGIYYDVIPVKVLEGASEIRLALHLNVGETKRLWMADDATSVMWVSNGPGIVDVDIMGAVTGVSKGLTIIEGTKDGRTDHIYVRVND